MFAFNLKNCCRLSVCLSLVLAVGFAALFHFNGHPQLAASAASQGADLGMLTTGVIAFVFGIFDFVRSIVRFVGRAFTKHGEA